MAEVGSVTVRITGDASGLTAAVNSAKAALAGLSSSGAAAGTAASRGLDAAAVSAGRVTTAEKSANASLLAQATAAKTAGKAWQDVGSAVDTITKPLQVAATATAALGVASAKSAISFEDAFAGVKKTVDATDEELEELKQGIIELSTTGVEGRAAMTASANELAEIMAMGGQLGIETENLQDFTEVIAQLGSATNIEGATGAEELARFMNVMQEDQGNIRNVGSAIVDLGNNFATTESEILDMSQRLGSYSSAVGISTQDTLAYATAMSSLGIEAAMGGSALGRVWVDMETAASQGGDSLAAFANVAGMSAEEFKNAWNEDASSAFMEVLEGLSESEDVIGDLGDMGISNTRDMQTMMKLANGIELTEKALEKANTAYEENTALQDEYNTRAETTASKLAVTKNNFVEAGRTIGDAFLPQIQSASEKATAFAQSVAAMDDETKSSVISMGAGVVAVGALSKATASGIKTVGKMTEIAGTLKAAAASGTAAGKVVSAIGTAASKTAGPLAAFAVSLGALGAAQNALVKQGEKNTEKRMSFANDVEYTAERAEAAAEKVEALTDITEEYQTLTSKINAGEYEGEELETANARIKELAELLEQDYGITINADDTSVTAATATIKELTAALEEAQRKLGIEQDNLYTTLTDSDTVTSFKNYQSNYDEQSAKYNNYKGLADDYQQVVDVLGEWQNAYDEINNDATISKKTQERLTSELADDYRKKLGDMGLLDYLANPNTEKPSSELRAAETNLENYSKLAEEAAENMDKLNESRDEYLKDADSYLTTELETLKDSAAAGEDYSNSLQKIGNVASILDFESFNGNQEILSEWAVSAAAAQNGLEDFAQAAETGDQAVVNMARDSIANMEDWGISSERAVQRVAQSMTEMGISAEDAAKYTANALTDAGMSAEDAVKLVNEQLGSMLEGKVITINAEGNFEAVESYEPEDKEGTAVYSVDDSEVRGYTPPDKTGTVFYNAVMSAVSAGAAAKTVTLNATGTRYFGGGLAMVNDQRGVADPRELIIDNGSAFIPEGRDVVLPLSKGARVYTAAQTKEIMRGLGITQYAGGTGDAIPHFAAGLSGSGFSAVLGSYSALGIYNVEKKINELLEKRETAERSVLAVIDQQAAAAEELSEEYETASELVSRYLNTHALSVTEQLALWAELSERFNYNVSDAAEIQGEIYSLLVEQNKELNEASESYLELRNYLNDWLEVGDDPVSAYVRINERNWADYEAGLMTYREYADTMSDIGDQMLADRISQSEDWLERQEKYYDMSTEDYIAGIDRMLKYTQEYYDYGMTSELTYHQTYMELADLRLEKLQELEDAEKEAAEEAEQAARDAADAILDAYDRDSEGYKKTMDTYYGSDWEGADDTLTRYYTARLRKWEELWRDGTLEFEDYIDRSQDDYLELYSATEQYYDNYLDSMRDYIDSVEQDYDDQISALRDAWDDEDREEDLEEVNRLLGIYKNAATQEGQDKYNDLLEQKKELEREQEIADLEDEQAEVLADLEEEYADTEAETQKILDKMRVTSFNIFSDCEDISEGIDTTQTDVAALKTLAAQTAVQDYETAETMIDIWSEILSAIKKIGSSSSSTTYNDSRSYSISGVSNYEETISKIINGTVVTGLANTIW